MKNIFIDLSPNAEKEDVYLALKILFLPDRWQKGQSIWQLEETFRKYFQTKFAISFASGRTALWAILKASGIQKRDEILIQAYTCVVVSNAVVAIGGRPVWVDIDPQTFNMDVKDLEKKITPRSRAIIVQHTFGQAAAMRKIIAFAKKHQLLVIEDCAQALGGEYQGEPLGTFGEVAFFSFGRDKIISSVFGGMAITNNQKIGERLEKIQAELVFPPQIWILQQLFHPLACSLIINAYRFFGLGKCFHFFLQETGLLSKAVWREEKKGQMPAVLMAKLPNALAQLALKQFAKLDKFNENRIKIAHLYARELVGLPLDLPQICQECHHVFLRYTIKTRKPETLINFSQKRGVFLGDWYRPLIAPRGVETEKVYYRAGSCPKAEKASAQSVNLPTHPRMTIDDAKKVVKIVKEFYGN